jgi:hypothetical protein
LEENFASIFRVEEQAKLESRRRRWPKYKALSVTASTLHGYRSKNLKYEDLKWNHLVWMCTNFICMYVVDDGVLLKWLQTLLVAEKDFIDQSQSFSNHQNNKSCPCNRP